MTTTKIKSTTILILLLIHSVFAKNNPGRNKPPGPPPFKWPTLTGEEPLIIARGGLSGFYPESSASALDTTGQLETDDPYVYADLQISKDGKAFLQKSLKLENSTNIAKFYPKGEKTYDINGEQVRGWFAVDYTAKQLEVLKLVQSNLKRPNIFDLAFSIVMTGDIGVDAHFWFNVPYYAFYKLRNVNVEATVAEITKTLDVVMISSPEIGFLKSMAGGNEIDLTMTTLIFQIPDANLSKVEPTTKQPYSEILKNLASIKDYASGILVPKELIWPVNSAGLLEPHTNLVADAHKLELLVFAYNFANDMPASYNYSYNPEAEYLQFVGMPDFSVDGVLSDFPVSAKIAIDCFAHKIPKNKSVDVPLIITRGGAGGIYPSYTDLAYQQAVDDGADVIDCTVQLSKEGVAFCLPSVDLRVGTTAATSLISKSTSVPEIQKGDGVFSFDCTATEIQSLKPVMSMISTDMPRHPENKNKGKITTLHEFLDFAKAKAVSGILIRIENAPYLASKKGLSITDIVAKELANATFDKQVTQKVFIQSSDTAVLSYFSNVTSYNKVFLIDDLIGDFDKQSVDEIKKVASAVLIDRTCVIQINDKNGFTLRTTPLVDTLHAANISVYVSVFANEYDTIPNDFGIDPYVELATHAVAIQVDGIVTEYPATANGYKRSPCYAPPDSPNIPVLDPGSFLKSQENTYAQPPYPTLHPANVTDPPLPPLLDTTEKTPSDGPAKAPAKNGQPANAANVGLCLALIIVLDYVLN